MTDTPSDIAEQRLVELVRLIGRDIYEIKQQLVSNQDLPEKVKQILNKGYYDE